MKIKMLTSLIGPNINLTRGDETEALSEDESKRLIEAGFAIPVTVRTKERATKNVVRETR